jgi:hypothetical protein
MDASVVSRGEWHLRGRGCGSFRDNTYNDTYVEEADMSS